MTVTYNIDEDGNAKLGEKYLAQYKLNPEQSFGDWLLTKLQYACSVTRDGFEIEIVFKEEKDLTLFLLTL